MKRSIVLVVAFMALVCLGSCQKPKKETKKTAKTKAKKEPAKLTEPPPECIITGSSLISTCAKEVAVSTQYFNITPGDSDSIAKLKIKQDELGGLLERIGDPTESCCKGTCEFTASYCGCNDAMIEVINGFIGNNFPFFRAVSEAIAEQCGIRIYYEENCPKNEAQKKWKRFRTSNCTVFDGAP